MPANHPDWNDLSPEAADRLADTLRQDLARLIFLGRAMVKVLAPQRAVTPISQQEPEQEQKQSKNVIIGKPVGVPPPPPGQRTTDEIDDSVVLVRMWELIADTTVAKPFAAARRLVHLIAGKDTTDRAKIQRVVNKYKRWESRNFIP
jgi:hypothetical protein